VYVPTLARGVIEAVSLASGGFHTCVARSSGDVHCWGLGARGQIGQIPEEGFVDEHVEVAGITDAIAVDAGHFHTCALRAGGGVKCWGANDFGQLGDGNATPDSSVTTPVDVVGLEDAVAVTVGTSHTCALRETGEVACWGRAGAGTLGHGGTNSSVPVMVVGLDDVVEVEAGDIFSCALRAGGTVWCWGQQNHGELGNGALSGSAGTPAPVPGLDRVVGLTVGLEHSCVIRETGEVRCWGRGDHGQLGQRVAEDSPVPVALVSPPPPIEPPFVSFE
jgi:alpha-tubulin suppressor-like RCC1 family protein